MLTQDTASEPFRYAMFGNDVGDTKPAASRAQKFCRRCPSGPEAASFRIGFSTLKSEIVRRRRRFSISRVQPPDLITLRTNVLGTPAAIRDLGHRDGANSFGDLAASRCPKTPRRRSKSWSIRWTGIPALSRSEGPRHGPCGTAPRTMRPGWPSVLVWPVCPED